MKLTINSFDDNNKLILLVNLLTKKSGMFESPEVSEHFPDTIGDIQIESVRKGQTLEDLVDGGYTTVVEGVALVALNAWERFRLAMNDDGAATLMHIKRFPPAAGREAQEVILGSVSLWIE